MRCIDVATDEPSRQVGWLKARSLDLLLQPPTHYLCLPLSILFNNKLYNTSDLQRGKKEHSVLSSQ